MNWKNILGVMLPWRKVSEEDCEDGIKDAKEQPFVELPLQAYKARRNMLLCGILCAAQGYGWVTSGNPTIAGMTVMLPPYVLNVCLLVISLYFGAYFISLAWEVGDKWRLRRTGVPDDLLKGTQGAWVNSTAKDVSQSTFWENVEEKTKRLDDKLNEMIKTVSNLNTPNQRDFETLTTPLKSMISDIDQVKRPLIKFEKAFWISQSKRWKIFLLFEFHGPIFFWFCCWLWLLGRIIFDVFLRCPAVQ